MNPEALKKPMFKREGEEVNGWIKKLSKIHVQKRRRGVNGWIKNLSKTRVQKRRRGDKWMDSEALKSMFRRERDKWMEDS
jgi:hypothetical protein